jgi:hypothetical protein
MTSIPKFYSEIYSDELFPFTEEEYDEVMAASLDDEKWEGYGEWSADLEQSEFERQLEQRATVQTANGPMLIRSECAHKGCGFTCKRGQRIGGIDV